MPYQNLDSEIMVAACLWLLAIGIFVALLVAALVEVVAENKAKRLLQENMDSARRIDVFNTATRIFQKPKGS